MLFDLWFLLNGQVLSHKTSIFYLISLCGVVTQNFNLLPHFSVWVKLLMFEAFYCL